MSSNVGAASNTFLIAKNAKVREERQANEDAVAVHLVDAAIAIHKALGPGLLASAYVAALEIECAERGLLFAREVPLHASYLGRSLGVGHRADLIVDSTVLVEVKSVDALSPSHLAQTLTYLRLGGLRIGLLMNFSAPLMKQGIKRLVNNF